MLLPRLNIPVDIWFSALTSLNSVLVSHRLVCYSAFFYISSTVNGFIFFHYSSDLFDIDVSIYGTDESSFSSYSRWSTAFGVSKVVGALWVLSSLFIFQYKNSLSIFSYISFVKLACIYYWLFEFSRYLITCWNTSGSRLSTTRLELTTFLSKLCWNSCAKSDPFTDVSVFLYTLNSFEPTLSVMLSFSSKFDDFIEVAESISDGYLWLILYISLYRSPILTLQLIIAYLNIHSMTCSVSLTFMRIYFVLSWL